jgi:hypothetical protein
MALLLLIIDVVNGEIVALAAKLCLLPLTYLARVVVTLAYLAAQSGVKCGGISIYMYGTTIWKVTGDRSVFAAIAPYPAILHSLASDWFVSHALVYHVPLIITSWT